jgi:hypothetical protein
MYGVMEVQLHTSFNISTTWRWLKAQPLHFAGGKCIGTPLERRQGGSKVGVNIDSVLNKKFIFTCF